MHSRCVSQLLKGYRLMTRLMRALHAGCLLLLTSTALAQITTETENNNTESRANGPIGSGITVSASIANNTDVDWYYFDVAAPGNINITLSHASGRDFDFYLYKPSGSYVLSGQTSSTVETGTYYATEPLRYRIKITRYSGTGAYSLNITYPSTASTPSPTPTATPSPTATATPTLTATPTATPTATASSTATPSPTPSATPSPTPSVVDCNFGARPTKPSGMTTYLTGNAADVCRAPLTGPGLLLMGGNFDIDEAFVNRVAPILNGGDVVVLRTNKSNGYQSYLFNLLQPDSVETLVIDTVARANSSYVEWAIKSAEFVYIAGGDQAQYLNLWRGTKVEESLKFVYNKGGVVGGISAGCAIMGEFIYDPQASGITSAEAVSDPCHTNMNRISTNFLNLPLGLGIITDTHFAQRNRMGRLMTFMARIRTAGLEPTAPAITGVGVDEDTSLFIDKNGQSIVDGDFAVYVLREDAQTARVRVTCNQTVIYTDVLRTKLTAGQTFNFVTGSNNGNTTRVSVNGSVPTNPY